MSGDLQTASDLTAYKCFVSAGTLQVCSSLHSICCKCWHSPGVPFLVQYMLEVLAHSRCAVPCTVPMIHETERVMCKICSLLSKF